MTLSRPGLRARPTGGTIRQGEGGGSVSGDEVDALIEWATQAAARIPWASLAPGPGDGLVIANVPPHPPLLFSMVDRYARLRAWIDGREATRADTQGIAQELAGLWWTARMTGDYRAVGDVLRDVVLWGAVDRMPSAERDAVRTAIVRRRDALVAAANPPPEAPPSEPTPVPEAPATPTPRPREPVDVQPTFGIDLAGRLRDEILRHPVPPFKLS